MCCSKKGPLYWFLVLGFGPRSIMVISSEDGRKAWFGCSFLVLVRSHATPVTNGTRKIGVVKKDKNNEKGCNTRTLHEVTHPSATPAQARLIGEGERKSKFLKLTQRSLYLQPEFLINTSEFTIQDLLRKFKNWKQLTNQNPKSKTE